MEDYLLKQAEIDLLKSKGFNMEGVKAGDVAVAAEIKALNLNIPTQSFDKVPTGPNELPVNVPSDTPLNTVPAAATQTGPAPAAPQQMDPQILQQLLSTQEASQPKPISYDNLSKTQRRMMAFAGLSDAGAALSGQKGGSLDALMGRFNEAADMERKRQAVQSRQKMLGVAMSGGLDQAGIAQLMLAGLIEPAAAQVLSKNLEDAQKGTLGAQGRGASAINQLETLQQIITNIDADPSMTTGPIAMFLRGLPFTQAGKTQALVDSLKSTLALDTLKDLKATGATMGALNKEELKVIMDDITLLDLAQGEKAVKASLAKIDRKYKAVIRDLYAGAAEVDIPMLDNIFGGRPSWLDASNDTPAATSMQGKTWNPEAGRFE